MNTWKCGFSKFLNGSRPIKYSFLPFDVCVIVCVYIFIYDYLHEKYMENLNCLFRKAFEILERFVLFKWEAHYSDIGFFVGNVMKFYSLFDLINTWFLPNLSYKILFAE